ncbi:hypothetical protein COSHB9_12830 [Companilactobacillus alimentarius]|uniref:Uncharacterized protein n=1 Tax=Companilactobacillus alimentarius DSM 20249 TaxID=1423720 RepID=A0A2K9HFX3_9LACO|nr:hypothetical protein [Companilactobacillus alimentarius]AUI71278.1 hypothetical protein LA20249_03280 [Companilactobacillus alimentarius DSM 20249]KRK75417.1 hypothetical protein FC67_GL001934 [Companilactobacillus alimentarius DSM 20249]MDT6951443.1 hypothetical protein [Companilactobacillus alimentarius]GEO43799.1 hypothetical protein LAL01_00310 [Companilactobacillus alimentarius]
MHRLKNIFPKKTVRDLYDQDGNLPKLFRTYNRRQLFELIIGLATVMLGGLGILFLILSLLDLYVFSYTLNIRNMSTGATVLMDKPEWQKYRQLYKQQVASHKNKKTI